MFLNKPQPEIYTVYFASLDGLKLGVFTMIHLQINLRAPDEK